MLSGGSGFLGNRPAVHSYQFVPRRHFEHGFAGTLLQAAFASSGVANGPYQALFLPVRSGCTPWPSLQKRHSEACTYAVLVGQSSCAQ
jgi:hypothetical protein